MTNLSIFAEHAKVKNYDAAYEPWLMVRNNCPDLNVATYAYGEKILMHKIEKSEGAEKTKHINDLMKLYDASLQYFPKKYTPAGVAADKAILMYDEKLGTDEELFKVLDDAFKKDRSNFKNPKALYLYFSTLVDLHNAGKKELQEVFDTYDDVTERIEDQKKTLLTVIDNLLPKEEAGSLTSKEQKKLNDNRTNAEAFDKISASIDGKLGALADCDKLIPLYSGNFPSKKGDAVWLKRAANRMDAKECSDDPLFIQIVEALHQLDPSAKSAYYLGFLNEKKGNASEAIKYYDESLQLETDTYEKAKTSLKIAHKYKDRGQKSTSRTYAQKALGFQPSMGRAYLLIASLYAGSANECGTTPFEKRAIYWLAADTARRAGQVDPSLKSEAERAVQGYISRAPSKTDIFNETMSGKTIRFNCWVGGSVKVPNL
ncbi:MAG: hypothetical protein KDD04_03420 [Sinomicrobium sp.]|nr:hypothetical protein [Sinomicrobium sp.]